MKFFRNILIADDERYIEFVNKGVKKARPRSAIHFVYDGEQEDHFKEDRNKA